MPSIQIISLPLSPYLEVWDLQKQIHHKLINGEGGEALIFCEHHPVITMGTSAKKDNILVSDETLKEKGIEIIKTNRGGDVTYHGPGQLIAYPILDLKKRKQDVDWYMRNLEKVIVLTLQVFGITSFNVSGKTGVWTSVDGHASDFRGKKIASLGVRISRWCTTHGLAVNVRNSQENFSFINPCGFNNIEITSMEKETQKCFSTNEVRVILEAEFLKLFSV